MELANIIQQIGDHGNHDRDKAAFAFQLPG